MRHLFQRTIRITEAYFPDLPMVKGKVIAGLLHLIKTKQETNGQPQWFSLKVNLVNNSSVNPFSLLGDF